eukprot:4838093-Amphidinium_carterae.1
MWIDAALHDLPKLVEHESVSQFMSACASALLVHCKLHNIRIDMAHQSADEYTEQVVTVLLGHSSTMKMHRTLIT